MRGRHDLITGDELTDDELEDRILSLAAHLAACTCRWLLLVAEYARRGAWEQFEAKSMAHWLSWRCGVSLSTAHEHVRVALALDGLPDVTDLFARGRLSYSKVRALSRIATPETEADLCEIAPAATASQLDSLASGMRRCQDGERVRERELHDETRAVRHREDPVTGASEITIVTSSETAAVILARADAMPVAAGEPLHRRRHDAFVELLTGDVRVDAEIVVHAPVSVLDGDTVPESLVHDAHVDVGDRAGAVPAAVVRRRACDARITWLYESDRGEPVGVERSDAIPAWVRRVVEARDRHCRFPGCCSATGLQIHHVVFRSRGGDHHPANLVRLCAKHHHAVHDRGYTLSLRADGTVMVVAPTGRELPDGSAGGSPESSAEDCPIEISVDATTLAQWSGDRLDRHLAVSALLSAQPASVP